ncbi:MAG: hypothetical protein AAF436_13540 [Myxococcota bacterium]
MLRTLVRVCTSLVLAAALSACGDSTGTGTGTGGSGGTGGTGGGGSGGMGASGGAGGASGTGGSEPGCAAIAEAWVIQEHCLPGFATEVIPFEQTGCEVRLTGAFSVLEGTIDDDGNIDVEGALGVMPYACQGTFDESEMLLTCTDDCPVRLAPQ